MIYSNLIVCLIIFSSCETDKPKVDTSMINVNIKIDRFDREMFEQKEEEIIPNSDVFARKYGTFYEMYLQDLLRVESVNDPLMQSNVTMFIQHEDMREVYDAIQKEYNDITWLEAKLSDAFKHYKYYFPDSLIPRVACFMSGLNAQIAPVDSVLGIGLDMYLGHDSEYYVYMGLPQYKIRLMDKDYIATDAIKTWVSSEIEFDPAHKDLLSQIIFEGKMLYITDALMPDAPDSLKIGFSQEQLEWCKTNEANIWAHFVDNKLLFSTNQKEINKYVIEGPFTPGFPRESPGRIGFWVGWQIVKAFMDQHEKTDLEALVKADPNEILSKSKYKPRD